VKKPRLEETGLGEQISASTNEASIKLSSQDTAAASRPSAAADHADSAANPVKVTRAICHWTPEEDAKLTSAVSNTCKKKHGKEYQQNWVSIAALVPGRTKKQYLNRWKNTLDPSIALAAGRTGTWTADEDSKLKDAVRKHGGKNWSAIAAFAAGPTQKQCYNRWDITDGMMLGK
jgi:hypothetical protein